MRFLAPLCPARTSSLENWKGLWIVSSPPSLYRLTLRLREGEGARKVTQRIRDGARREGPGIRARLLASLRPGELPSPPRSARRARSPAPCPCSHPPGRCTAQGGSTPRAPPPPWWGPTALRPGSPPHRLPGLRLVALRASASPASIPEATRPRRSAARGGRLPELVSGGMSPAQLRTASQGPRVRTRGRGLGWLPRWGRGQG